MVLLLEILKVLLYLSLPLYKGNKHRPYGLSARVGPKSWETNSPMLLAKWSFESCTFQGRTMGASEKVGSQCDT